MMMSNLLAAFKNNNKVIDQQQQPKRQKLILKELQVQLFEEVKTLEKPSLDLRELSQQVQSVFKQLENLSFSVEAAANEEVGLGEFAMAWIDQPKGFNGEPQQIMISDNDQLEEIYLMHQIKDSELKIKVVAQEESFKQSESAAQSLEINQEEEFKSVQPEPTTASQLDLLAQKFQLAAAKQSHVLDEIQSQRSEEFLNESSSLLLPPMDSSQDFDGYKSSHDEEEEPGSNLSEERKEVRFDNSYSSSDDEEEEDISKELKGLIKREIDLQVESLLREHYNKEIGEQVKQVAYQRYNLEPPIPNEVAVSQQQIQQQVQVLDQSLKVSFQSEEAKDNEEEKEEEYVIQPQYMHMYASMTNSQIDGAKPQVLQKQQMPQKGGLNFLKQSQAKMQPIIQGFKNLFKHPLAQPNDRNLYAMVQERQEIFIDEADIESYCMLQWKVKNQSQVFWPPGVQLELIYSHPQSLGTLAPGESQDIQVNIFLPKSTKLAHQIVMFRLRHPQTGYLGQPLFGFIRLKHHLFEQLRSSTVSLKSSQLSGSKARSQFFEELDDEKLLGMASILVDEGYGTFDRCYSLIRTLRGDMNQAKEIASQLIFYELETQSE